MVDAPDRSTPRFPPGEVTRVAEEIREAFRRWGVAPGTTVVCGGARGADIIAAEEALALGARVKLCLALPPDEFEQRSVALPGSHWSRRFHALLAKAEVRTLAEAAGDGDGGDDIFVRTNQWIVEEARALAGGRPHAVVVWDGRPGDGAGGTADFVHRLGYDGPDEAVVVVSDGPAVRGPPARRWTEADPCPRRRRDSRRAEPGGSGRDRGRAAPWARRRSRAE